jgi:hypothetical protein
VPDQGGPQERKLKVSRYSAKIDSFLNLGGPPLSSAPAQLHVLVDLL